MNIYIKPLMELIGSLKALPGIGPRSAERIALSILEMDGEKVENLREALRDVKENVVKCPICFNITDITPCAICVDDRRDQHTICVVEGPRDLIALENNSSYKGLYHVLEGVLSPIENIGPEDIRIKELLERVTAGNVKEVIIALNPRVEGEATALYLAKMLHNFGVKVTRLAQGMPIGGELEYADEMTITHALDDRKEL